MIYNYNKWKDLKICPIDLEDNNIKILIFLRWNKFNAISMQIPTGYKAFHNIILTFMWGIVHKHSS